MGTVIKGRWSKNRQTIQTCWTCNFKTDPRYSVHRDTFSSFLPEIPVSCDLHVSCVFWEQNNDKTSTWTLNEILLQGRGLIEVPEDELVMLFEDAGMTSNRIRARFQQCELQSVKISKISPNYEDFNFKMDCSPNYCSFYLNTSK